VSPSVLLRGAARADLRDALRYYARSGGEDVALSFADSFEATTTAIARRPVLGALYRADPVRVPGLRTRRMERFPYLVFYVAVEDSIDVLRVLHEKRDIPKALARGPA
jgi:toxin ParE1/3/4